MKTIKRYRLKSPNYGLPKGSTFIYITCPNLYMLERNVTLDDGTETKGGDSTYRFTPQQIDSRYFEAIK